MDRSILYAFVKVKRYLWPSLGLAHEKSFQMHLRKWQKSSHNFICYIKQFFLHWKLRTYLDNLNLKNQHMLSQTFYILKVSVFILFWVDSSNHRSFSDARKGMTSQRLKIMRKLGHVITTSLFIGSSRKTFVSCLDEGLFFKIRGYAGKTSSWPSKVVRVSCGKSTQNYNSTTNGKYRYW